MSRRTSEVAEALKDARRELLRVVDDTSDEEGARRPTAERWSAAEILHHLAITERQVARIVDRGLAGAPHLPPPDEDTSVLDRLPPERVVDRSRRFQAPPFAAPDPSVTLTEARRQLDDSRRRLLAALKASGERDLSLLSAPHPFLGPLDFYQWFLFVALHDRRHTRQLLEFLSPDPSRSPS